MSRSPRSSDLSTHLALKPGSELDPFDRSPSSLEHRLSSPCPKSIRSSETQAGWVMLSFSPTISERGVNGAGGEERKEREGRRRRRKEQKTLTRTSVVLRLTSKLLLGAQRLASLAPADLIFYLFLLGLQAHSHLMTFALTVPSARNTLPGAIPWLAPRSFKSQPKRHPLIKCNCQKALQIPGTETTVEN